MDYINAFWVGGVICALAQILMEKTKMLPGRIMVTLVCTGAVLGAISPVLKAAMPAAQKEAKRQVDILTRAKARIEQLLEEVNKN